MPRQPAHRRDGQHRLRNGLLLASTVVLVAALAAVGAEVAGSHQQPPIPIADAGTTATSPPPTSPPTVTTTSAPAVTTTTAPATTCPLTGAPVPGGGPVPARPALAVKVDNYWAARPQTGLGQADIVFEEPVEGGITRYVAVYQCQEAAVVGPIRSARNIDIGILGQFGQPALAHVGGIDPVIANIEASPLINLDLGVYGSVAQHPSGRLAPYDTYASTSALWGLRPSATTPPAPVFQYSATPASGSDVGTLSIPFSSEADVAWQYDPSTHLYLRSYGSMPDVSANNTQQSATNVVVQFVQVSYGPWSENASGALEVQANLYEEASGAAEVFRDGVEVTGTWSRNGLGQPTQFTSSAGPPIALAPGRTWVELVPSTIPVSTGAPA
jgi:hypothetical protein